jgi:hypothetical protein
VVLIRLIGILLGLSACVKVRPPAVAPAKTELAAVFNLSTIDAVSVLVPSSIVDAIGVGLGEHNLVLVALATPSGFVDRRATGHRFQWLQQNAGTASHVLLVQANAVRLGEVGGRYRWVVDVHLEIGSTVPTHPSTIASFSVPVHLQHAHQGAEDALQAASLGIVRRAHRLVNDYLGGTR